MKFNKLFKRSILGDYDRDGVMNAFDCKPKNKKRQDSDSDEADNAWEELSPIKKALANEGLLDGW